MEVMNNVLVGLGLFALLCCSCVAEKCTTSLFGNQTMNSHLLTTAFFPPGTAFQLINIHTECNVVGVLVTACDDVAPNIVKVTLTEAQINRLGTLKYPGHASVIAYCPVAKRHNVTFWLDEYK